MPSPHERCVHRRRKAFPDTVPKSDAGRTRIKLFQRWLQMASDAKSKVGEAAVDDEQGIHLHGGMGTSDEQDVSHYFKWITAVNI